MMEAIRSEKARRAAEAERERIAKDAERIRARCQTLAGFFREAWHVLEPQATLAWNWHLDAICSHLEAVTRGEINRLLINVPPGSSKSLTASVIWQAWEWTFPQLRSMRYLTTAFNDGPVTRDTRKCRDLIRSEWYRSCGRKSFSAGPGKPVSPIPRPVPVKGWPSALSRHSAVIGSSSTIRTRPRPRSRTRREPELIEMFPLMSQAGS
jgi:hypothetical protein